MTSTHFMTLTLISVFLSGVSADQRLFNLKNVSLNCSKTENVTSGGDLTLTCNITWNKGCVNGSIEWNDTVRNLYYNETRISEIQQRGNKTTLPMFNVTEDKNITVKIVLNCDMDSKTISVKVIPAENDRKDRSRANPEDPDSLTLIVCAVIIGAALVGVVGYIIVKKGIQKTDAL